MQSHPTRQVSIISQTKRRQNTMVFWMKNGWLLIYPDNEEWRHIGCIALLNTCSRATFWITARDLAILQSRNRSQLTLEWGQTVHWKVEEKMPLLVGREAQEKRTSWHQRRKEPHTVRAEGEGGGVRKDQRLYTCRPHKTGRTSLCNAQGIYFPVLHPPRFKQKLNAQKSRVQIQRCSVRCH